MNNTNNNSEEVDLGQLFNALGKLFKRFFDFLGAILYKIFLALIWFIFFLKKNIIILIVSIILGFAVGFISLKTASPIYRSNAVLKQNYALGDYLYTTIDYYNGLIAEGQSETLAEILGITKEEAVDVIHIELSADFDENEKMIVYNDYYKDKDTSLVYFADFEVFAKNLKDYDHKFQVLSMKFAQRGLFNKALKGLVNNLNSIDYFKNLQQKDFKEIELRKDMIKRLLAQSDSLKKVYQRVLEMPAETKDGQTSITIENGANRKNTTKEYELYMNDIGLMNELVDLERKKDDLESIIEVVSVNNNAGNQHTDKQLLGFNLNIKIYYAALFFSLAFLFLLIKEFLNYLERFKNKI